MNELQYQSVLVNIVEHLAVWLLCSKENERKGTIKKERLRVYAWEKKVIVNEMKWTKNVVKSFCMWFAGEREKKKQSEWWKGGIHSIWIKLQLDNVSSRLI